MRRDVKGARSVPAEGVTPALIVALTASARDGTVSCPALRSLAEAHGVSYRVAGTAADSAGIKIHSCDLGCF